MTTTEISKAYDALHERWPELRPSVLKFEQDTEWWYDTNSCGYVSTDFAHAACFMACIEACEHRGIDVRISIAYDGSCVSETDYLCVPLTDPHSIVDVMPHVMKLPEIKS